MSDWIKWDSKGCPVDPDAFVFIRLSGDKNPNEGLYKRPVRAGSYKWSKASGITHYIEAYALEQQP